MKSEIREIITDIKAAVHVGLEETLWLSLDALLDLPEVSGNPKMEESFILQVILPIGETLATSNLTVDQLKAISKNSYAAFRSISAVALTFRYFSTDGELLRDLEGFIQDPRRDVRSSLSISAAKFGTNDQTKYKNLIDQFIQLNSPNSISVAISLLPTVADEYPNMAFAYLAQIPFSNDNELRRVFSEALTSIAQAGQGNGVLDLMNKLENRKEDYLWIITKSLSSSWAIEYPEKTFVILKNLTKKYQSHKLIRNAIKAFIRHGDTEVVDLQLSTWKADSNEHLRMVAEEYISKD
ncbi:MAG: hypothetical protein HON98_11015 [Chloroflexi bacterium]|jgi:hypothetical protein|nr:hypothetical protein [Chloroflexota bacterium]MBT3670507.1 hypothetical protein [Chloroflexota bacterium]MBT4003725.1 hypothetical protein [Chloroflexota bacterium]MBT4306491.1 hypothetical protein [Chloroflexota bacterium]MBT4534894.1 hypothetical protein [Chloroflexota bacterium]